MAQTQPLTLKAALDQAALAGFSAMVNTHDAGQRITLTGEGAPNLSFSYDWGDEPYAIGTIVHHVAEYRRREDDPHVQHELPTIGGY